MHLTPTLGSAPCRAVGDEPRQLRHERDTVGLGLLRAAGVDLASNLVLALHQDNVRAVARPEYGDYLTLTLLLGGAAFCRRKTRQLALEYSNPGAVSIQPHDVASVWDSAGPSRWLHFFIPPALAGAMAEAAFGLDPAQVKILPETGIGDPELLSVLYEGARAMFASELVAREALDHWARAIVCRLLTQHSTVARRIGGMRGDAIAGYRLRQVYDFVEAHLCGPITLEDLANVARMSTYHFAHAFRAQTGLPPYKYVQRRRIERSRRLLDADQRPVGEVAQQMGYSSQAHFSTAFRRELGITPREYRRFATGHASHFPGETTGLAARSPHSLIPRQSDHSRSALCS
jgi:AraC family transcriptional regulator